jgi:MFS family permease
LSRATRNRRLRAVLIPTDGAEMRKNLQATRWNPTWTLIGASLALMMAFLDALVVTTALPTLRASLHSSVPELEWTINAYNLVLACMLRTGAALGDRCARRQAVAPYTAGAALACISASPLWERR